MIFQRPMGFYATPLVALVLAWTSGAAIPQLPVSAVSDDTFVVAHLQLERMDPATMDATLQALLGPQAAQAAPGMANYKQIWTQFTGSGAESAFVVVNNDASKPDKASAGYLYLKLKEGTDPNGLIEKIKAEETANGKPQNTEFSAEKGFLVVRSKDTPAPAGGSSRRLNRFTEVLNTSKEPVSLAFMPTEQLRQKMKQDLKNQNAPQGWTATLLQSLADAQWGLIDVKLGRSPTLTATVQAADDAGAKNINDGVLQAAQSLKALADQLRTKGPQFGPAADAYTLLASSLKPTQTGSKVSLTVEGQALAPVIATLPAMLGGKK